LGVAILLLAFWAADARSWPGMTGKPEQGMTGKPWPGMTIAQEWGPGPHPRLLVGDSPRKQDSGMSPQAEYDLESVRAAIGWLPVTRQVDSVIVAFSDSVMHRPVVERKMIGRRLLHTSREALKRIFWLSFTYRVHGGEAYARRAIDEMLAVSAFSDWNPAHFLDVGEMTMAVAIGYDWLYDLMTPGERATVAQAIIDKGLKPALNDGDAWFYRSEINWNAVCNAGMVYGALAVWEEDPDFCRSMLEKSLTSKQLAYKAYEGGGYPEGYNYWGYGTSFQIMLDAAVRYAFPYNREPEYALRPLSSDFIRFTSTPAGNCFSFSDAYRKASGQYMQAWVGGDNGLYPEIRIMEETGFKRLCEERLLPMFLIGMGRGYIGTDAPEDHYFQCGGTTPVFVYRSGWKSREDDYLGVKGGLTMSSHSHCDQGSFYFESDGVAWATDLGMQDYNSLESAGVDLWDMTQDSERWSVFRIGPFSHNILTVNGHVPKVNHPAAFSRTWAPEQPDRWDRIGAELDLTDLYTEDLDSCKRAVYLLGGDLHVVDLIQAGDSAATVRWAMCTEAATVTLRPNLRISEPGCPLADQDFILRSGWHERWLQAEILETWTGQFPGPGLGPLECEYHEGDFAEFLPEALPPLKAGTWPTTYDPASPEADGMQFLHPTDVPNPGVTLVGYTFTLKPHQKVVLHVVLSRGL
jgi:hypothetical protein